MAAVGFILGFLPWIVYWILVGNSPFRVAVLVALAVCSAGLAVNRLRGQPWRTLDVGSLGVFVLLAVAAFVVPDAVLERWLQPLGNAGLFLVALVGVLVGKPFVREYAESSVDPETARTDGFRTITTAMTWLWVAAFGAMTVLALIPPIVDGAATIRDTGSTLSVVCYWGSRTRSWAWSACSTARSRPGSPRARHWWTPGTGTRRSPPRRGTAGLRGRARAGGARGQPPRRAVRHRGEVPDTPSWTLAGAPVPWRPLPTGVLMRQLVRNGWRVHRDIAEHRPSLLELRPAYEAGLAAPDDAALIAAERAPGRLLFLTGDADELWPSGPMAEALLARRGRPDDRHVAFPGAGHLIRLGVLPTDAPWTGGIAFGGDRSGLAAAQRRAAVLVVDFLRGVTAPGGPRNRPSGVIHCP